ncbi:MAG: 4Fe-4S binding protein [Phycisphaerae bacterium]|nr:4Fe-4S binding protein [Phycisphaerae bacterium]
MGRQGPSGRPRPPARRPRRGSRDPAGQLGLARRSVNGDSDLGAPSSPRRQYAKWRVLSLVLVHALIVIHIAHWLIAGWTLAPLELNEVLYTLELGIVTAGFVFMALALLSTAIFGRFFCSWACHMLALQDLSAWLLEKCRIRPKPVRSRLLLAVPVGAMLYMFAWPHLTAVIDGRGLPLLARLHTRTDGQGWGSFTTSDFWRNLPGLGVAATTLFVCGFAIVYLLGSRSFCTYACPYGALFAIADRLAPGKIRLSKHGASCTRCGVCTAACSSHIRVHQELTLFGRVVSPACLKDLDCVSACPVSAIEYGAARPSGFLSWRRFGRFGVPYDFSWSEEALMALVFVASLLSLRGLYGRVPFLLSLALAGIAAFLAVIGTRFASRRDLRLAGIQVKRAGTITRAGWCTAAGLLLALGLLAHSALIRWHDFRGGRAFASLVHRNARGESLPGDRELRSAIDHLEFCDRFGLFRSPELSWQLASLHWLNGRPVAAAPHIARLLKHEPCAHDWRIKLAAAELGRGRSEAAETQLVEVLERTRAGSSESDRAVRSAAHVMLGDLAASRSDSAGALEHYRQALAGAADPRSLQHRIDSVLASMAARP